MSKHIGIVGVSPEGAAIFYRQLARQADRLLSPRDHPRVTLHSEPLEDYLSAIHRQDWVEVARLLRRSAEILARCGCDFCLTPDNAVEHGVHLAAAGSPLPWLTMTELVANAIATDKRRAVGLIGTKWVTNGTTYQTALGLKGVLVLAPEPEESDSLHRIIVEELLHGQIRPESRHQTLEIIQHMAQRQCEGVILACSEAPLLITTENCPIPVYDAADLLAGGAVRHALA